MMRRFRSYPTIGGRRGGIPSGWVEVEYIAAEFRGHAYIDTGISSQNGYSIDADADMVALDANPYFFMGAESTTNGSWWANGIITYVSVNPYFRCGSSSAVGGTSLYDVGENHVSINFSSSGFISSVGSNTINKTTHQTLTSGNIYLLGHPSWQFSACHRLKNASLKVGGVLMLSLVPVRNATTNEGAMCDVLTGEIYHNSGTGAFVVGPDKGGEVIPYQRVEYVKVTDLGYFDTPIQKKPALSYEMDVAVEFGSNYPAVFGSWSNQYGLVSYGSSHDWFVMSGTRQDTGIVATSDRTTVSLNNGVFSDGTSSYTVASSTYTSTATIHIGQLDNNTVIKVNTAYYSVKMSDGTNDIDCVPVKLEDGSGGLWDRVSQSLLTKSSTGTFTAGPEL